MLSTFHLQNIKNENYFTCDRQPRLTIPAKKQLLHMKIIFSSLLGFLLRCRRFLELDDQSRSCCILGAHRECMA